MTRVLVTGSRRLDDPQLVRRALDIAADVLGPFVLVHGALSNGADKHCDDWARECGFRVDQHPADWKGPCTPTCGFGWQAGRHRRRRSSGGTYCPAAGPRRNREMVELGAYVCLAWPLGDPGEKSGTRGCMDLASAAGIPVIEPMALTDDELAALLRNPPAPQPPPAREPVRRLPTAEPTTRQTFCIYCQREYTSPKRLANHLVRIHPGTYAAINLTRQPEC